MKITSRELLIALHNHYDGDWHNMYNHIMQRMPLPEPLDLTNADDFITIVDTDYPEELKQRRNPSFVISKKETIHER